MLGSLLCLLTGTMLGMLFRSSPGALVAYFVYSLLLPTVSGILPPARSGSADVQPWVDLNLAESALFEGTLRRAVGERRGHVHVWLVLPALLGLRLVMRSEVK